MDTLYTPRMRLEPLGVEHADELFPGLSDERLYEFIAEQPPKDLPSLRERYRRLSSRSSPDGSEAWLNWAVRESSSQRCIGYVQATVRPDHSADVAYVLVHSAWGHGYGREAVTEMVAHLRSHWQVSRLRASVDTRNRRSAALLEALGFQRVAVHPEAEVIHGVLTDEAEYLLAAK